MTLEAPATFEEGLLLRKSQLYLFVERLSLSDRDRVHLLTRYFFQVRFDP